MILQRLAELAAAGRLRQLDYQFAAVLADAGESDEAVLLAAALVSERLGAGDVCADLAAAADGPLFAEDGEPGLPAPPQAVWLQALQRSALVGTDGADAPLVLVDKRLYLGRYHRFEADLGHWVRERAARRTDWDSADLKAELDRLFPAPADGGVNDQRVAAAVAALHPFCVISGGPGTGKTTTVTRILALLLRLLGPLRIALAAPTGKAAARLGDSLRGLKATLDLPPELADRIPEQVVTLHRLLGLRGDRAQPTFHRDNPLHCDLLVVDEASMVDLPLMARLTDALGGQARLILLGDKDQLASVEAGSVLGDICDSGSEHAYGPAQARLLGELCAYDPGEAGREGPAMADAIALLRHSYRFDDRLGIGRLAREVNRGDADAALTVLQSGAAELHWQPDLRPAAMARLVGEAADRYAGYLALSDPGRALDAFAGFRILCALRAGPQGVQTLNRAVEEELQRRGVIPPGGAFYPGRPLMVTRNDYGLGLFNGDIGLLLPDAEADGALRAFFRMPDDSLRSFAPSRLPQHETVFAMTVHKSQGSEFDHVLLVLPVEPSPVATRELLYTGITRARGQVRLAATRTALGRAVATRSQRVSGLRDRVWGDS